MTSHSPLEDLPAPHEIEELAHALQYDYEGATAAAVRLLDRVAKALRACHGIPHPGEDVCHHSHPRLVATMSSTADFECVACGARDITGGGWGQLARSCPGSGA